MEINRNNYEEFFLLYIDGELNAEEMNAVEKLAEAYPDLGEELHLLMQTRLPASENISFENKALLYRNEDSTVHEGNYPEYLASYIDNELTAEESKQVELFIQQHPESQLELSLLQRTKLEPDNSIVFVDKQVLYRTEKQPARIVPFAWWRGAVAAAVIIIGGFVWMNISGDEEVTPKQRIAGTIDTIKLEKSVNDSQTKEAVHPTKEIAVENNDVTEKSDAAEKKNVNAPKENLVTKGEITKEKQENTFNNVNAPISTTAVKQEAPVAITKNVVITPENKLPVSENVVPVSGAVAKSPVKPVLIDEAALNGENKNKDVAAAEPGTGNDITNTIENDNTEKKSKGKFRGIFRKASRFIDRVTNAETGENQPIVRVASFEIAKK
ncbi:MAG: hypothetical protein QM802_14805 [Agriterribacter sp.]